ncbi:MAG TPA: GvpL/GvpF family gas vesicle protein [Longimicrobiales bacterium]|nr:GvpL/GvpF family gas vesicle protein [Longimicrobiales bacterium]
MSGVYAYCILPGGREPPDGLAGLGGAAVRAEIVDGLTVWLSAAERAPEVELDAVERHHEVVRAALPETMLPLRFGAWAPDLDALAEHIRRTRPELDEALRCVEGRIELGVRVREAAPAAAGRVQAAAPEGPPLPAAAGVGRRYLHALSEAARARALRRRRQEALARRIREHLGAAVVDERVTYLAPPEAISVAHLVRREDEPYYRSRLQQLAEATRADYILHVTGPWPPYSFAAP